MMAGLGAPEADDRRRRRTGESAAAFARAYLRPMATLAITKIVQQNRVNRHGQEAVACACRNLGDYLRGSCRAQLRLYEARAGDDLGVDHPGLRGLDVDLLGRHVDDDDRGRALEACTFEVKCRVRRPPQEVDAFEVHDVVPVRGHRGAEDDDGRHGAPLWHVPQREHEVLEAQCYVLPARQANAAEQHVAALGQELEGRPRGRDRDVVAPDQRHEQLRTLRLVLVQVS
mmetsp:Transcript_114059/g.363654  ORF Transcript_114059/g.363654 Transcript_114059/m.363654 type:complete len:229 (+) Transcript_114059:606-1292(+)